MLMRGHADVSDQRVLHAQERIEEATGVHLDADLIRKVIQADPDYEAFVEALHAAPEQRSPETPMTTVDRANALLRQFDHLRT